MADQRDPDSLRRQLTTWIRDTVEAAGLDGTVLGLSGGIDSAVVCGLASEALGPERCLGLVLPIDSAEADARLACETGDRFGVKTITVELEDAFRPLLSALTGHRERAERLARGQADGGAAVAPLATDDAEVLARANLKPRLRMVAVYYFANLLGYMVLGTGNKDEFTVGYFTKYGDGAADAFPLADLVKGEVRALARELDVPEEIVERPPSAGLWPGQTDESELGITYEQLDRYVLTGSSGDEEVDGEIARREAAARHKTEPAPIARPE